MKRKQLARVDLSNPDKPRLIYDADVLRMDLKAFKHDQRVYIILESYSPKRSLEQNSLLHVWITILADEIGVELEDMKYLLKDKFLKEPLKDKNDDIICDENGAVQYKVRDTSSLSKAEMCSFMDNVFLWAQDFLTVHLPQPLEQIPLNFDNLNNK